MCTFPRHHSNADLRAMNQRKFQLDHLAEVRSVIKATFS